MNLIDTIAKAYWQERSKKWLLARVRLLSPSKSDSEYFTEFFAGLVRILKGQHSFWYVIPPIIFFAALQFTHCFDSFRWIPLKQEEVLDLLDKRLTNFTALFTLSITISVFLITALNSSKRNAEFSSLAFRESYMYPIIYASLACIFFLNAFSFSRGNIELLSSTIHSWCSYRINPLVLGDELLLFGFLSFTCLLLAIGVLFKHAYAFLNTTVLMDAYYANMRLLASREMKSEIEERISRTLYFSELTALGFVFGVSAINGNEHCIKVNSGTVKDVNLARIKSVAAKFQASGLMLIRSARVAINQVCFQSILFTMQKKATDGQLGSFGGLYQAFKISKGSLMSNETDDQLSSLKSTLLRAIRDDNEYIVKRSLSTYETIYAQYVKIESDYGLQEFPQLFMAGSIFTDEWRLISLVSIDVSIAMREAVKGKHTECVRAFISHHYQMINLSIEQGSTKIFDKYIWLLYQSYQIDNSRDLLELLFLHLQEIVNIRLKRHFSIESPGSVPLDRLHILNRQYHSAFTVYSELLRVVVEDQNLTVFKMLCDSLAGVHLSEFTERLQYMSVSSRKRETSAENQSSNGIPSIELDVVVSQPTLYLRAVRFGTFAWITQLYVLDRVSKGLMIEFVSELEKYQNDRYAASRRTDVTELFQDILVFVSREENLFRWRDWDTEKHPSGVAYSSISPIDWLFPAFILRLLRENLLLGFKPSQIPFDVQWNYNYEGIVSFLESLKANEEKWKDVVGVPATEYQSRIDSARAFFDELKSFIDRRRDDDVIAASLDAAGVQVFHEEVCNSWLQNNLVRTVANHFGVLYYREQRGPESRRLSPFPENFQVLWNGKRLFVPDSDVSRGKMGSEYGYPLAQYVGSDFIAKATNGKQAKIITAPTFKKALDLLIARRNHAGLQTTLIIDSDNQFWSLYSDPDYKEQGRKDSDLQAPFVGSYKDIPCISLRSPVPHAIVACDFAKAFSYMQFRNQDLECPEVFSSVGAFNGKEAEDLIATDPNYWLDDKNGGYLSTAEAIRRLLLSLRIEVWTDFRIEIRDANEYDIARIESIENN